MSAIAMKWAWELQEHAALPPTSHHVLLCLADHFNAKQMAAWPSYPRMVLRTGLSERTIRRAIADLEARGLIAKESRISSSGRKVGLRYTFPQLDHDWAAERISADFSPVNGDYDPEMAEENSREMAPAFDFSDHLDRALPRGSGEPWAPVNESVIVPQGWSQ